MARLHRGRARRQSEHHNQRNGLMFWLRLIIVFLLVAFLIVQVLRLADQPEWRESELETAMSRFGQTAMLANIEWHRRGRTSPVEVRVGQGAQQQSVVIHLNSQGWPLPFPPEATSRNMNAYRCADLWRQLSAVEELLERGLSTSWREADGVCVYLFKEQEVFTYRVQNGHLRVMNTN